MILIAHRGLTEGPNKDLENKPEQIKKSLKEGFDCEVDVWWQDYRWFLGHDAPTYEVDYEFLRQSGLWIHAKNVNALYVLGADPTLNYFWHQNDDFTLTSQGDIWTYPGKDLTQNSVQVLPEWNDPALENIDFNCLGICSDYVSRIRDIMPNDQNY